MRRRPDGAALGIVGIGAVMLIVELLRAAQHDGVRAFDIYTPFYPNMIYALNSLRHGGHGLLWNSLQNCGEPFFGISSNGLLYPAYALFLLLPFDTALLAVLAFNVLVAGISTYFLCRELGVGKLGAVCGALAFELGNSMVDLTTWTPVLGGSYAWLPAAMLVTERLLRDATLRRTVVLTVILALAWLPGHPQVVFFMYQLIGLRVLWEVATRRSPTLLRAAAAIALALVLAPLLVAVQLVPAIEMARESVRSASLSAHEMSPYGLPDWARIRSFVTRRSEINNPLVLAPCILACASLFRSRTRRSALFYFSTALLSFALSFGSNFPLYDLYAKLPVVTLFREPDRFVWITSFCIAVLTGLGVDAIAAFESGRPHRFARSPLLAIVVGLAGFSLMPIGGLLPMEWLVGGTVLAGAAIAVITRESQGVASLIVGIALALNLLSFPDMHPGDFRWSTRATPFRRLLPSGKLLFDHSQLFTDLRSRMTAQDRAYMVIAGADFSLQNKTGSLFDVPSLHDYEPQPARRYSEFFVMMRRGFPMNSLFDVQYPLEGYLSKGFRRRLLNIAAGRYMVVANKVDTTAAMMPPPPLVDSDETAKVYENTEALPRAFYVPGVIVIPNSAVLLHRLAFGRDDLSQVAFVEEDPPSGRRGTAPYPGQLRNAPAQCSFVTNEPEHVVLHVDAPNDGFLYLADTDFPGWYATVNGAQTPIMRANYAFRLVEVPKGESTVEFRYTPRSVRVGALISAATILGLIVVLRLLGY